MKSYICAISIICCCLLFASCGRKIINDRKLYGSVTDSSGKPAANYTLYVRAEKTRGTIFNKRINYQEPFKFTTDANGFFNVTYNSQKGARVIITDDTEYAGVAEELHAYWSLEPVPNDNYNVGVVKLK